MNRNKSIGPAFFSFLSYGRSRKTGTDDVFFDWNMLVGWSEKTSTGKKRPWGMKSSATPTAGPKWIKRSTLYSHAQETIGQAESFSLSPHRSVAIDHRKSLPVAFFSTFRCFGGWKTQSTRGCLRNTHTNPLPIVLLGLWKVQYKQNKAIVGRKSLVFTMVNFNQNIFLLPKTSSVLVFWDIRDLPNM